MNNDEKLLKLGTKVLEYRKQFGFSKKLSTEIQSEVAILCQSGVTPYALEKAIGVQRNTITDWSRRYAENKNKFSEVNIVDPVKPNYEVKLYATVQGCRVEIFGSDYSLLQRLLRKMST